MSRNCFTVLLLAPVCGVSRDAARYECVHIAGGYQGLDM